MSWQRPAVAGPIGWRLIMPTAPSLLWAGDQAFYCCADVLPCCRVVMSILFMPGRAGGAYIPPFRLARMMAES